MDESQAVPSVPNVGVDLPTGSDFADDAGADDDADEERDTTVRYEQALEALIRRLDAAGIRWEKRATDAWQSGTALWFYPLGAEPPIGLPIMHLRKAALVLHSEFENCRLLPSLEGIVYSKTGTIEVQVRSLLRQQTQLAKPLFGQRARRNEMLGKLTMVDESGRRTVALGPWSKELRALSRASFTPLNEQLSLRLDGWEAQDDHTMEEIVTELASALFFQIDLESGVPLTLVRRDIRQPRQEFRRIAEEGLRWPTRTYQPQALALYWYGRSAHGMPLLQFLAYYQVLEFYFPVFSRAEAIRRVTRVLKNPMFRLDSEADVARVLQAVNLGGGSAYGDERKQLKATLRECLTEEELRDFIQAIPERLQFMTTRNKPLTETTFNLKRPDAELINVAGDRIYDIRCRIVHTKGNDEVELLLPFSPEASLLEHDIALVEFAAQQALIVGSRSMEP